LSRTGSRRGFPPPPATISYVLEYYRDPVALFSLVATSLLLTYGGGAVLFWFHAIYLGEAGPSLIPLMHWAIDSTLGFLALTPPLGLLIPLALRKAERAQTGVVPPWRFAIIAGTAFAIITAPGPLVHDAAVGRGKWLAVHITLLLSQHLGTWVFRRPGGVPATEVPWLANVLLQVDVGWPTYVLLMRLSYRLHTTGGGALDQRPQPQYVTRGPAMAGAGIGAVAPAMAGAPSAAQPAGAMAGGAALIASLMGQSNGQHGSRGLNHDGLGGVPAYYDISGASAPSAAPAYASGNGYGHNGNGHNGNGHNGNGHNGNGHNSNGLHQGNGGFSGNGNSAPRPPYGYQSSYPPAPPPPPPPPPPRRPQAPPPPPPSQLPLGPLGIPESVWLHRPDPADPSTANPYGTSSDWPLDDVDTGQWLAARAAVERGSRDDLNLEQWLQQLEAGW